MAVLNELRNMSRRAREAYFRLTKRWARIRQKHYAHKRHKGGRRKP